MYALAEATDARPLLRRWPSGTYAEMGRAGITLRRRVRLPALHRRADRGGARGRHPAHAARRLLSRGRLRRAAERGRSSGSATATRRTWAERVARRSRARRSARRSTPSAPSRADQLDTVVEFAAGRPLHFHVIRAARRERGLPGRDTASRRSQLLAEHGALGPDSTAVHATHLTPDDRRPSARARRSACARPPSATSPTGSATPGPRLALGSDSHADHRPVRGGPRGGAQPAPGAPRRRGHFTAADLLRGATNHACLGWEDAGRIERRRAAPTWSRSASARRAWRPPRPDTCSSRSCSPPPPRTSRATIVGREC